MNSTLVLAGAICLLILVVMVLAKKYGQVKEELSQCKMAINTYEKNAKIDNSPDHPDPASQL